MATDDTPTTPAVPEVDTSKATDQFNQLNQSAKNASLQINDYLSNTGKFIDSLVTKFSGLQVAGKNQISLSGDMAKGFDLVTQSIFGATNAYDAFDESLNKSSSFTSQLKVLEGAGALTSKVLKELATSLGAPEKIVNGTDAALKGFIGSMASGADQSLKFQSGFLQMMGAAGGLNSVFLEAGNGAQDLNQVLLKQSLMISDIAGAAGKSSSEVVGFYKQLGSAIPESVTKQASGSSEVRGSFNTLSDAMKLAAGTGRDTSSVIKDMTTAWETYGLTGEDALKFTSQMSDLSSKFNINLSYTEGFIKKNADAFKLISDNADNGAQSFNRWFDSLRNTGLSAKESTDIISRMTGQIAGLTIAQKGFLSAQSGGPGGLRGALQIENLLREGKIDEVLAKAEEAVKKQFGGRIYSQAEAQTSDFAAGQFIRQRQLLQSSAFGGLAKNDQDATRILEAFKSGTKASEALKSPDASLNDNLKRGEDIQSKQLTQLSRLTNVAERQLAISSNTSLDQVQKVIGGSTRTDRTGILDQTNKNLQNYTSLMNDQLIATSSAIKNNSKDFNVEDIRAKNLANGVNTITQYSDTLQKVGNAINTNILGQNALPNPGSRFVPPGTATGYAVDRSVNSNGQNNTPNNSTNQHGNHQVQQANVDVTVRGLCWNCNKTVQPDPTTVAITSGTVGAKK